MHTSRTSAIATLVLAGLIAGCGSSRSAPAAPSALLEHVPGSKTGQIVLSAIGAQRIGVQIATVKRVAPPAPAGAPQPTQPAAASPSPAAATSKPPAAKPARSTGPRMIIPYSALVYDPSGATYAFQNIAPLTYVEVPVSVEHISGNSAYLLTGPRPGTKVVSVGAEELFGIQTGVLAQT